MPVLKKGPNPDNPYPMPGVSQVGFLKPLVDYPMIEIGEYTYYDDPAGPEHFVERCVRYHFEHMGDRLIIGRFCAVASGVQFIMNGANHALDGLSTYPFAIFGEGSSDPTMARVVKRRFDDEPVEKLLSIAWWNWPPEKITANLSTIRSGSIEALQAIDFSS